MLVVMTGKFCTAWCERNRVAERLHDLRSKILARIGRAGRRQAASVALGRGAGGHSHSTSTADLDMSVGIELEVNPFSKKEGQEGDLGFYAFVTIYF